MHRLIGILYKLNEENVVLLEKILPSHGENDEILEGWSALVYSVRTSLAKTAKDTSINPSPKPYKCMAYRYLMPESHHVYSQKRVRTFIGLRKYCDYIF